MATSVYSKIQVTTAFNLAPSQFPPTAYHPLFSSHEADVILRSLEGTLYRLHSVTLHTSSGLFATMFSLPQPKARHRVFPERNYHYLGGNVQPEIIDVYEKDFVLERILRLVSGFPLPKWESIDEIECVLRVAEKWDTPGPIAQIRLAISTPDFLKTHPLRVYAVAKHFGWRREAEIASTHTLAVDLRDAIHSPILEQISSKDLLPLLNLRRKRRDRFRELINSPERFTAGNRSPYYCLRCGAAQLDNRPWQDLKTAMILEIDRNPLGDTLGALTGGMAEWPEALACWKARCSREGCGGLNYNKVVTLRQIRACVDLLPQVIED